MDEHKATNIETHPPELGETLITLKANGANPAHHPNWRS